MDANSLSSIQVGITESLDNEVKAISSHNQTECEQGIEIATEKCSEHHNDECMEENLVKTASAKQDDLDPVKLGKAAGGLPQMSEIQSLSETKQEENGEHVQNETCGKKDKENGESLDSKLEIETENFKNQRAGAGEELIQAPAIATSPSNLVQDQESSNCTITLIDRVDPSGSTDVRNQDEGSTAPSSDPMQISVPNVESLRDDDLKGSHAPTSSQMNDPQVEATSAAETPNATKSNIVPQADKSGLESSDLVQHGKGDIEGQGSDKTPQVTDTLGNAVVSVQIPSNHVEANGRHYIQTNSSSTDEKLDVPKGLEQTCPETSRDGYCALSDPANQSPQQLEPPTAARCGACWKQFRAERGSKQCDY
ncbi:hypothetical protein GUITHDRAFT_140306 [Guillardia theta CCMP2712]|uniref:Uncharacterized protein n=1 Tax=Guillardia theta (strain CCMP2712) TaxID=905079 RepID=L1J5Y3_GUITC|nr:hypothetical protein GUITHDRAFT_140306 [Guillardia theta CCMP2712]EKX43529.1 hypothetical protein GUITHDRAFT_140306 [Guillardia theta CCMP2712]|eukprot:XP_005830509.1 hypothetical protein GUITHDRAFT_140306 [Guillardia theta CCMP2712]